MGSIIGLLLDLVMGGVAGFIAGKIMHSEGGIIRNIIVGIVGGFVGGFLFGLIGIGASGPLAIIGGLIIAVVGACLCLFIVDKFFKMKIAR